MQTPTLNYLELSGSPYQIGLETGRIGAEIVNTQLYDDALWEALRADVSKETLAAMETLIKAHHPYVLDELYGLARGLELPFYDVLAWNCRADLHPQAVAGSTTIMLPGPDGPRIYHNEDGAAALKGHCALVTITPDKGPAFATLITPGTLAGNTFTVTENGQVVVVDDLRWLELEPALPRTVVTRALLAQPDLSGMVGLLNRSQRMGGCHLALAHSSAGSLLSIEFNASRVLTTAVDQPCVHTDHALNEKWGQTPQLVTPSSLARHERLTRMLQQPGPIDPLQLLADQEHPQWPVFREQPASDQDGKKTLASVAIETAANKIEWAVYEHPEQAVRFHMRNAHHI